MATFGTMRRTSLTTWTQLYVVSPVYLFFVNWLN